ncbi:MULTISPECIES: hypothetical protein [unclassified Imperialibacter]|uniref:hypothetical protein n=1 Tax=unclassified Imperialibacter TaxID=2629706 RepID=UPI001258BB61|nr:MULTISPECIES: hypothetical protein [unclassified Imperialibacter]CAD5265031.1 hypothetical protein IMPERIA89_300068 [Imperialibacter sp. 89]CAD5269930.1 hypothetical protein IMPERIA75_360069 [Imperialibacter sp. 75]VVT09520.1 hypothetical protein IMPR6_180070 [Imperialibacter sp. EC-SDR9]
MKLKNTYALLFTIALGVVELKAQIYTDEVNVVEGDGKVGIGTSELTSKLNVLGQNAQFFSGTSANSLWIGRNTYETFQFRVTDSHGYLDLIQDETGDNPHIMFLRNLSPSVSADNDIRLQTSGANRLVIKGGGNVGIGTSSPGEKLDVSGNIKSTGDLIAGGAVTATGNITSSATVVGGGIQSNGALYFGGNSKIVRLYPTTSTIVTTSDIPLESNSYPFWAEITIIGNTTHSGNKEFLWHGALAWDSDYQQYSLTTISAVNFSAAVINSGGIVTIQVTNTGGTSCWVNGFAVIIR